MEALCAALDSLRPDCSGEFFLDDFCFDDNGTATYCVLVYSEAPVYFYDVLRSFDLRRLTPREFFRACLRLIFPDKSDSALSRLEWHLKRKF